MNYTLRLLFSSFLVLTTGLTIGQERYLDEVFTDSEILVIKNETLGAGLNVDPMKNPALWNPDQLDQGILATEHAEIVSALQQGQAPPTKYFDGSSTLIKLTYPPADVINTLQYDVYMPDTAVDTMSQRPVLIYLHTGNFLPKAINLGVTGLKDDSTVVKFCTDFAKRGYVAVAVNYRLGWNAQGSDQATRVRSLLNAVYRAIQDTKYTVRTVKSRAADLKINPDKVGLFGQGSGGYVALAYNCLDRWEETALPKFNPTNLPTPTIDTNLVGFPDATGGLLNFYDYQPTPVTDASIAVCVNVGGALADLSWIEGGEAPFITVHSPRDEFAPFVQGTVIVPGINAPVVEADGPNLFIPKAKMQIGNWEALSINSIRKNDLFKMYPNPAEDIVVIESKGKVLEEVVIMDISGKVVNREQTWNQTMAIDVKDLKSGVYFVKVRSNEEEFVEKLIIQ
jgi:acetyl esterase/lipase